MASRPARVLGLAGVGFAAVSLGLPVAAQVEAPAITGPSLPSAPAVAAPAAPGGFVPPAAPGSLAPFESRARPGSFGFPFNTAERAGPASQGLTFTPSLALEQIYNDNIRYTPTNRREDLITRITPSLRIQADTARLQGGLTYAPSLDYYWRNTSENRVNQNFNGQMLGTVIPDRLFIDARGQAAVQSLSGGVAPESEASGGRDNQVQTYTFSVSPYLVQRFRGLATARVGYVLNYVNQNRADRNAPLPTDQLASSFTPSEYTSHQGYITVRTGEDFGRYAGQATVSNTEFVGSGLYEGAFRRLALLENRYSITRAIAVVGDIGVEAQKFNTVPVTDFEDIVWAAGVRLTPGPDTTITAKYGRRDGFNSFFLESRVALGVRTTLFANYNERLTSSALDAGSLLGNTTIDALGNVVDAATGQPIIPSIANSNLGIQSGLSRTTTASVALSQQWDRDTLRFTVTQTERQPVADAPGATAGQRGFAQESTSFSLSWSHELAETTVLTSFAQYSLSSSGRTQGDTDTYGLGTALSHRINPSLTGVLSYRLNIRDGGNTTAGTPTTGSDDRAIQNIITAGVRQSF
jgi:uncharacterized protein (PEP-CTERM system associated)